MSIKNKVNHVINPPYEGKEHQFLEYKHVHVYFIYSFSWDCALFPFDKIVQELKIEKKGWELLRLHQRNIACDFGPSNSSYQPNLILKNSKVLQKSGFVCKDAKVIVPIEEYTGQNIKNFNEVNIDLMYTIRIFDNCMGSCTFTVCIKEEQANFKNIHYILRLAQNVDSENISKHASRHLVNSFLKLPSPAERLRKPLKHMELSFLPNKFRFITMNTLFYFFLVNQPSWFPSEWKNIWIDPESCNVAKNTFDWQNPFIFTVAETTEESYLRFMINPTISSNREVASILCKITLDNRYVEKDYVYFSEDYISDVLKYNINHNRLTNLCLDRRLFFTFSRRGALAITPSFDFMPSFFVIPSLLNLLEILKTRCHLGTLVNIRLDKAIEMAVQEVEISPSNILDEVLRCRTFFGLFLQDPIPFLFDGGSITEVAEMAEEDFWLTKLREETYRKFITLDRLVQDILERKRIEEFIKWQKGEE